MSIFQLLIFLMFISYYIFCLSYCYTLIFDDEYTVKRHIFLWLICFAGCLIFTPMHLAEAFANANKFK